MVKLWWWIGVGATVLMVGIVALWWLVPKWQLRSVTTGDPKARADIEDNFRKTIGQALGGAVALIGAGIAYLQFTQQQQAAAEASFRQQTAAAAQLVAQQKTTTDQIAAQLQASEISRKTAEDLRISNQVAKGFEQLGSDKMVVRLGGIYALEGVMNGSEQYHEPILEALCAFVRESTKTHASDDAPTTDVEAALTVIVRRVSGKGDANLRAAQIPEANLNGARLTHSNLSDADLSGTQLTNSDLSDANLMGADLRNAVLSNIILIGSVLLYADLSDANLSEANLRNADLTNADLSGADLRKARNLTQRQLNVAFGVDAKLPPGLTLPPQPQPGTPLYHRGGILISTTYHKKWPPQPEQGNPLYYRDRILAAPNYHNKR